MSSAGSVAGTPLRPLIEFRAVHKWFGSLHVLKDINLAIAPGEVVAFCGPSGSGKSTLVRLVNRLEEASHGEVLLDGVPTAQWKGDRLRQLRTDVGFVFQQFNLYPHLTARENITLGLRKVQRIEAGLADARAEELLGRVGLGDKLDAWPEQLSGGQQQRVAIARALAPRPRIVVFDEPTSALDPEMTGEVLAVLRELAHSGITMLIVTHEMAFAREIADRIVFMEGGEILETATPETFFGREGSARSRRFLQLLRPGRSPRYDSVAGE